MKVIIFFIAALVVGLWCLLTLYLLGHISTDYIALELPKTMAELGDSVGLLNGILSSAAVVLALVAVLLQGKELKKSTEAQNEQASALKNQIDGQQQALNALTNQLKEQQKANQITALQAQQNYHLAELSRMDKVLDSMSQSKKRDDELFNNSFNKKNRHKNELENISKKIDGILYKQSNVSF